MQVEQPYLIFIGDVADELAAKLGHGVVDWRREWCTGQMRLPGCKADLGIPDMGLAEARDAGARTFVVGCVNAGGFLPEHWVSSIVDALDAGFDVAAGLHSRLGEIDAVREAAERSGGQLHDLRFTDQAFETGKGRPRPGKRLLAMGTDCSVGKKYTALALERAMRAAGMDADFVATGQTGILISGRGVAIDSVISDFIAGAAEWLSPAADPDHWHVIEGQGSLFHPSYAGVTLGLLHGSQPDAFVVCHEPTRTRMRGVDHPLPTIAAVIEETKRLAALTQPDTMCCGICVNTQAMEEAQARDYLAGLEAEHGVPATDPVRFGCDAIVALLQRER